MVDEPEPALRLPQPINLEPKPDARIQTSSGIAMPWGSARAVLPSLSFLKFRHLPLKRPSAPSHDAGAGGRSCLPMASTARVTSSRSERRQGVARASGHDRKDWR